MAERLGEIVRRLMRQKESPALARGASVQFTSEKDQNMDVNVHDGVADRNISTLFSAAKSDRRRGEAWLNSRLERVARGEVFTEADVRVSPALAEMLLAINTQNRSIRDQRVKKYGRDMREGNYRNNGQPIIVSDTGELNDGQHRLLACINTGCTFVTDIKFGAIRETMSTVDTGAARTPGNALAFAGYKDPNNLGRAALFVWQIDTFGRLVNASGAKPTHAQILETVDANPGLQESLPMGRSLKKVNLTTIGLGTAIDYLLRRRDKTQGAAFMRKLADGTGLSDKRDPILKARNRLMEITGAGGVGPDMNRMAVVLLAWNAFRRNERPRSVKWHSGLDFPTIG